LITNTNTSNYNLNESYGPHNDEKLVHRSSIKEENPNFDHFRHVENDEDEPCDNYYCLPVEDRNLLWNAAREHKLESIRRMTCSTGLEECTFQPKLVSNRVTRRKSENYNQ
jgi:hypothetical protein